MRTFNELELVEEYKRVNRCRVVAEKFGCSDETVRRALIKYDVPRVKRNPRPVTKPKITEEEKRAIVDAYYSDDVTIVDLEKKYKRSYYTIRKAIEKYGHGLKEWEINSKKVTDEQILEDIALGLTRQEIADKYGMHVESLARRMKNLGVYAVHAPNYHKGLFGCYWHYSESVAKRCNEQQPDFEYVEHRNKNGVRRIRLKCKCCGTIVERADATIREKNVQCDNCKQKNIEQQELLNARVDLVHFFYALKEKQTPKQCICCGNTFYSVYPDAKYCSNKCRNSGRGNSYRSRCRKYKTYYDPRVKRIDVLKRDKYVCQICGKICNPNDRRWGIIGPDFPTVDHIIPLAKGGTHTWGNVQCAHAMCNSEKRDLITA